MFWFWLHPKVASAQTAKEWRITKDKLQCSKLKNYASIRLQFVVCISILSMNKPD